MSSPFLIDPYLVLNVSKSATITDIRAAHRRLVLKYHPDRIKDEAEQVKGKEEFQKVQQAYELLIDEGQRAEYDRWVSLKEARKEALKRDPPDRAASYPARAPRFTATREYKDGFVYEERVPHSAAFFDDEDDRFREEPTRASARKAPSYSRKTPSSYTEKKSPTAWKSTTEIPIDVETYLHRGAADAHDKARQREVRAAFSKMRKTRDQERRRSVSDKYYSRTAHVDHDSSTDSDTATYIRMKREPARPSSPRRSRADRSRRHEFRAKDSDEDGWSRDKHQDWHASARDYIQRATSDRPRPVRRQDSAQSYFEPRDDGSHSRRSGSDRDDKRNDRDLPKSARSSRRPSYAEFEPPPRSWTMPTMPKATSSPSNIKIPDDRKDAPKLHRAATAQTAQEYRKEAKSSVRPGLFSSSSTRRSNNPTSRTSNLKHTATHDSGYASSSPTTPNAGGTSSTKHTSATRYQIVDEAEEFSGGPRTVLLDSDEPGRRTKADSKDTRPKRPSRAETAYTPGSAANPAPARPTPARHESARTSSQTHEPSYLSKGSKGQRERKPLYREVSNDEPDSGYRRRVRREDSSEPSNGAPEANHGHFPTPLYDEASEYDYLPGSTYRTELRYPGMGSRRPSVV